MKLRVLLLIAAFLLAVFLFIPVAYASQGCCSWHGGQSHCSDGRWVCNDGTYSPTCTCGYSTLAKSYYWNGQTYHNYQTYMTARWDDIQDMYQELLFRPFNSQEEGHIYTDQTDKNYWNIRWEILGSDEYRQKHPPKPVETITQVNKPEKYDWSWLWGFWWLIIFPVAWIYDWFKK